MYTHIHTRTYAYTHTCIYTYMYIDIYISIYIYRYTCVYIYTHIHTHRHRYIYIYRHMYWSQKLAFWNACCKPEVTDINFSYIKDLKFWPSIRAFRHCSQFWCKFRNYDQLWYKQWPENMHACANNMCIRTYIRTRTDTHTYTHALWHKYRQNIMHIHRTTISTESSESEFWARAAAAKATERWPASQKFPALPRPLLLENVCVAAPANSTPSQTADSWHHSPCTYWSKVERSDCSEGALGHVTSLSRRPSWLFFLRKGLSGSA